MLSGTVLAIFFVPLFFVLVRGLFKGKDQGDFAGPASHAQPAAAAF